VVRNFRFFRGEDDAQPLDKPIYHPGDGVWARFDITGFKYGPNNRVDVSYVTSVIAPSGKALWTQPEPAVEQSESFYPSATSPPRLASACRATFVPANTPLRSRSKTPFGNQTGETKQTFTVAQ